MNFACVRNEVWPCYKLLQNSDEIIANGARQGETLGVTRRRNNCCPVQMGGRGGGPCHLQSRSQAGCSTLSGRAPLIWINSCWKWQCRGHAGMKKAPTGGAFRDVGRSGAMAWICLLSRSFKAFYIKAVATHFFLMGTPLGTRF